MAMAANAGPMPRLPSFQITMKAPNASTMPITANTSAPAKVARAGSISRMPERTIRIDSTVAASEKKAQRRAQMASRDVGSSANLRRAMLYPGTRVGTAHSGGASSGLDVLSMDGVSRATGKGKLVNASAGQCNRCSCPRMRNGASAARRRSAQPVLILLDKRHAGRDIAKRISS
jgi:hypothetical protein